MFALCPLAGRDRRHAHRDRGRSRISIHAPHAGRDKPCGKWYDGYGISIHAPREGRDTAAPSLPATTLAFQSTRPARGATCCCGFNRRLDAIISIHAPREGRDPKYEASYRDVLKFQSTRPARGATGVWRTTPASNTFQSTRPARGATSSFLTVWFGITISIHAPREGRDCYSGGCCPHFFYFNPRAPRGARRVYQSSDR